MKRNRIYSGSHLNLALFAIFFIFLSFTIAEGKEDHRSLPRDIISFGLFTDTHYTDVQNSGTRYCTDGDEKLIDIINKFNERKLTMAFMLGDYISSCHAPQSKEKTIETLISIDSIFKNFVGERHYVLGNHDLEYLTKDEWLSVIDREGLNYYSFNKRGLHFIILDTMYNPDGSDAEPNNFQWDDLYISAEELEWLKNDLLESNMKPTFIFTHLHLYRTDPYHAAKNYKEVQRVLETYGNVQVVFQGHNHHGSGPEIRAGIHYIGMKAVTEGPYPDENAYSIITIRDDGVIVIEGFGHEENRDLIGDYYVKSACENESGEAYKLCNKICEKMDCDIESNAKDSNCEKMLDRYFKLTGEYPPCWNKVVFISSKGYQGDLGGIVGADRECQSLANYAGLTGSFKAWLSDDVISAGETLTHSAVPYLRTDGATVAENWTDLTDGSIQNKLIYDEYQNLLGPETYKSLTWTNTNFDGSIADQSSHCANWTTTQDNLYGIRGQSSVNECWSNCAENPCDFYLHLYCIEQ